MSQASRLASCGASEPRSRPAIGLCSARRVQYGTVRGVPAPGHGAVAGPCVPSLCGQAAGP
eukprot:451665-Hanusia_phi.AAC.1